MQAALYHTQDDDRDDEPPFWSGRFEAVSPQQGILIIAIGDRRTHRFPEGWFPDSDSPLYIEDREVWVLNHE